MCFLDLSPSCHNVCYKTTFFVHVKSQRQIFIPVESRAPGFYCLRCFAAVHGLRNVSTSSCNTDHIELESRPPCCLSLLHEDAEIRRRSLDSFNEERCISTSVSMKPGHNKAKATISKKVFISLPSENVKTQRTNFILDENSGMSAYELEISCNVSVYFSLGLSGLTTD